MRVQGRLRGFRDGCSGRALYVDMACGRATVLSWAFLSAPGELKRSGTHLPSYAGVGRVHSACAREQWSGSTVLRSVRELLMVTWLARKPAPIRAPPKKPRSESRLCGQVAHGGLGRRSERARLEAKRESRRLVPRSRGTPWPPHARTNVDAARSATSVPGTRLLLPGTRPVFGPGAASSGLPCGGCARSNTRAAVFRWRTTSSLGGITAGRRTWRQSAGQHDGKSNNTSPSCVRIRKWQRAIRKLGHESCRRSFRAGHLTT